MIKAIIIFNNLGRPRLLKFYQYYDVDTQQRIVKDIFQVVSCKEENVCNFISGSGIGLTGSPDDKLVFRHYATLYFVFCVDSSESELAMLDLIQVFVETLDKCFESVCELDLVYHSDKVHHVLDELVMGGLVLETNMAEVLSRCEEQNRLEKEEYSPIALKAAAVVRNMNITHQLKDMKITELPQAIKDLKFP